MAELRHLVTHCEFGDFLSQALRDRFACSLRDCNSEATVVREEAGVAVSIGDDTRHAGQKCFCCGYNTHLANACKFAKSKCFLCGKTGYLRNVCRSKSAGTGVEHSRAVRVVQGEMNLTACNPLNSTNSTTSTKPLDHVPPI